MISGLSDVMPAVKLKFVAILSMSSSGKPLGIGDYDLKVRKIYQLFFICITISLYRGVLGITISNLEGKWPSQSQKVVIFYTYQTGSHIFHDIIMGNPLFTQNAMQKCKNGAKILEFSWQQNIWTYTLKFKLQTWKNMVSRYWWGL